MGQGVVNTHEAASSQDYTEQADVSDDIFGEDQKDRCILVFRQLSFISFFFSGFFLLLS